MERRYRHMAIWTGLTLWPSHRTASSWLPHLGMGQSGYGTRPGKRRRVKLWDTTTGASQRTLKGDSSTVAMAFSPDSKQLASASSSLSENPAMMLWDTTTGAPLQVLEGHSGNLS